ncbi:hypothetical protein TIN4_79 [Tsukamurella phage TIN4]|uniref:Cobalamin biosynthesis protein CobT VWA domain-containing protein n=2 Tax=Tinduovirus TIN3 TaxID=1982571 RepID=A0A0K0N5J7_9CAUD|nr:cobalamin biosynthesis protein [Tsukamurella phage TIN3]YP_009604209.1 cobalamin biosynthesis protein [Tsukamurella phage TIN4]AKJ71876.1 hypothetical protein TIN3_79 [Tsukamurella phage TIN3]AKJ71985.1 hypothetical protein TIN4_79 [Tsukamurella phage TIN4]
MDATTRKRRQLAAKAVRRFNTMIPALQSYARSETGVQGLKIVAGANSQTDGKTITIAPPMELGLPQRHNRALCDEREFGLLLCPACASREHVMTVLKHEIGHIVHGSFARFSVGRTVSLLMDCGTPGDPYSLPQAFVRRMQDHLNVEGTNIPLIGHVNKARHPWLSMLMLCMEDARCDAARLAFDHDEELAYRALSEDIMVNGISNQDGTVTYYEDMKIEMQLALAFLFTANGIEIDGFFVDEVVDFVTGDAKLKRCGKDALEASDTVASFEVVLAVLTIMNENGYMIVDPDEEEKNDELFELINKLMKILFGHGTEISDKDDGKRGMGSGKGDDGPATEGLRPEDVQNAVDSYKMLDHVPENVGAPKIYIPEPGQPAYKNNYYNQPYPEHLFKSDERHLSPAITAARLAFGVNARVEHHRNQRSGKVAGKMLARRVPFGDERLFSKRVVPDKRSYHVVIGMDISGSTSGDTIEVEKMAVLAMSDVCHRLGISFEVWAHTSDYSYSTGDESPAFYEIKAANKPWDKKARNNLRTINSSMGNLDGHTLQFYRKRAEQSKATEKIVMYYTDGAMPASNYDEELRVLKSEIEYARKNNITLMAVGMGVDSPKEHGFDTFQVDGPEDYRKVVEHLGKRLL